MKSVSRMIAAVAITLFVAAASLTIANQPKSSTTTEYVTKTGTKYHRAGCSSLRKSSIPMDLAAAAARYGPCPQCKPPLRAKLVARSDSPSVLAGTCVDASPEGHADTKSAVRLAAVRRDDQKGDALQANGGRGQRYCWQHGGK